LATCRCSRRPFCHSSCSVASVAVVRIASRIACARCAESCPARAAGSGLAEEGQGRWADRRRTWIAWTPSPSWCGQRPVCISQSVVVGSGAVAWTHLRPRELVWIPETTASTRAGRASADRPVPPGAQAHKQPESSHT
jgi:hypothetical protein